MQAAEAIPNLQANLVEALQDEVHALDQVIAFTNHMDTTEQVPRLQESTACYEVEAERAVTMPTPCGAHLCNSR